MANRKQAGPSVRDCMEWLWQQQQTLLNSDYGINLTHIRQDSDFHDKNLIDIRLYGGSIERFRLNGYAPEDVKEMEVNYSLLKELSTEKQKCLGTLLQVAEIEEYYQTITSEVDKRALELCAGSSGDEDGLGVNDRGALVRNYNASVYAVRSAWDWLIQASRCMDIHLRNGAAFHQFFHEIKHYDKSLKVLTSRLRHYDGATRDKKRDVYAFIKEIKSVLQQLLDFQAKIDELYNKSVHIVPLQLRVQEIKEPLQVEALTGYKQNEITVKEGEKCLLLDNSQVSKWRVRNSIGQEGMIPALVFLIPPPDREAVLNAQRLRHQLLVTWKDCVSVIKMEARRFLTHYFSDHDKSELRCMNPSQRAEIIKTLGEMLGLLTDKSDGAEMREFQETVTLWEAALQEMKGTSPDRRGHSSTLQLQWNGNKKLLRQIEEFVTYVNAYREEYESTTQSENFLVSGKDGYNYISKAYIERLKPQELEIVLEEDENLEHPRHLSLAEKVPSPREEKEAYETSEVIESRFAVETNTEMTEEETETSQTIKETQTFVIRGVIDPRTDEEISIYMAIAEGIISQTQGLYKNPITGESMPIPEAMNRGLILVEFTNKKVEMGELIKKGIITTTTTMESVSYSVKNVTDPITGRRITVAEAIEKGIINQAQGKYVNPITGETMSITDAIDKGLLDVEVVDANGDAVDGPREGPESKLADEDLVIMGIRDPKNGRYLSLQEAIDRGLVDAETGIYHDPKTGESMPLREAMKMGIIKARLADPVKDKNNPDKLNARILKVLGHHNLEELLTVENGYHEQPLNVTIYESIRDNLDGSKRGIKDPVTGDILTIDEAIEKGLLHLDPLSLENSQGDKYSLQEAFLLGLIEPQALKEILRAMEPNSLAGLIESGLIDPKTGEYIDPKTKKRMSIAEAIEKGLIDPNKVFFTDGPCRTVTSLSAAIENNKFDPATGKITDPKTGKEMSLADAMSKRIVDPNVDAEKLANQMSALKFLKENMDTNMKGVKNTVTGADVTVEEAVMDGILDIPSVDYVNLATSQSLPIPEASNLGLIEPLTAKTILAALSQGSLQNALEQANIDPNTGKFIHPDTKRKMTIKDAIDAGHIDPSTVFLVDPSTGAAVSLDSMIKDGRFNPATGKFKDPLTNLEVSMANAIRKGIINPVVDPEMLIEERAPLKKLLDTGKVNTQEGKFVTPDGQTIPLKEAMANGYITPDSVVKIDPKSGDVQSVDDADIIRTLINTKKNMDWVGNIEKAMAASGRAPQDGKVLERMEAGHRKLQKDVEKRAGPLNILLDQAQELLENNKQAAKNPGSAQQYQRLRFNTSDLKVRFETVNSQLDSRLNRLDEMIGDLDRFHEDLDVFDNWMGDAGKEVKEIKDSVAEFENLEGMKEDFKAFNDVVLAKEDEIRGLTKAGRKVQEDSKEYAKEADVFRSHLPKEVGGVKLQEPEDIIEQELEAANDKFKGVLSDCEDLMAKLTDTASKNKQYNQLRAQLGETLPTLQDRLNACQDEITPGVDPKEQLEELKGITADAIVQGKCVEDLQNVGHDLIQILEELDCRDSPKAREIQNTIDTAQASFDRIQEDVVDKQHKLNAAVMQSQDVDYNLNSLLQWIEETENIFDTQAPVSLDKDKLNHQIQDHRVVASDIENQRGQIDSVVDLCQRDGANHRASELLDRYDMLIGRCQDRGQELEDIVGKLGTLHSNVQALESWLTNAVHSLKRESSDFDHSSLKQKIEKLYKQKKAKEEDLKAIKTIGKELIADPSTGDKNRLRETMADVQSKWHDLTELLVQMISFAALREIDDLLKYLDKAENDINTAEPISTDPETLAVQLRDHKAFHEDLESKKRAVNDTIDKCNKMLRETTNEEAEDIKNKLDTIRNQADLVCKLSHERLELLEEALPLASHFSETHADLQSWLGEIEAEIESLDVPADGNTEQVKKQQDNAKVSHTTCNGLLLQPPPLSSLSYA